MVASTTSAGALLLVLIQLSLPTTVVGGGCTETTNGWVASKDCTSYYWCSFGVVGQFYECVHSELFDETSNMCVNAERTNFQCPGLNYRDGDVEGEEAIGHTTTTAGSLTNPNKMYCSTQYIGQYYDGECGAKACPSGQHGECPGDQRCYSMLNCKETIVVETPAPAPEMDLEAIDFGNPGDWYCSATWNPPEYTGSCGYPCPNQSDQACPSGQKCFANQPNCQDVGLTFMGWMNTSTEDSMTAMSSVGTVQDTDRWCGLKFDDMASKCAVACPGGTDEECPGEETCFADSPCKITSEPTSRAPTFSPKPTISPKPTPKPIVTAKPTKRPTQSPTPDSNPNNSYCKSGWDGACGKPCPTGFNDECDLGQFCFQHQADCKDAEKEQQAQASTRWCGKTFDDMANRCHQECPGGTDEECSDGEKCFADSQCGTAGTTADIEAKLAESVGKLWCGKTYRHLVENCSKECPNGTDDECGDGMTCFNMSEEETSCSDEGVGIQEKIDPAMMWCGETWLHMLENCPKACPDGSDEECGPGMSCFDMTNEEKPCLYVGYGVKEKDDPSKRFCGNDYKHMHESCPKKCPSGSNDDCPGDMKCFSNSECQVEGVGVVAVQESDPSSMYCGSKFEDASKCSTPCPSGGLEGECQNGETCYADVVCGQVQTSVTAISKPAEKPEAEVSEPIEETEPVTESLKESATARPPSTAEEPETEVTTPVEESKTEEAIELKDSSSMYCGSKFEDASKCGTPCPSGGDDECQNGETCYADVVCGQVYTVVSETVSEEESTTEEPPSNAEIFMDIIGGEPELTETETEQVGYEANYQPSSDSTLVVENLEVILYGMTEMTTAHVYSFERHTATYLEDFYNTDSSTNNAVRDSVANYDTSLDVLNVEGPSRRNLRARRALASEGFRMTYLQRISYDADLTISLEQVLEYPFNTWNKRNDYVDYLKAQEPHLFKSLSAVSSIILTDDMFVEDGAPLEAVTNIGNKFKGFKCHHTGLDCPTGECNAGDICMFFSEENDATYSQQQPAPIESAPSVTETAPTHESKPDASNILDSVLDGQASDSGSTQSDTSTRHGMTDVYAEIVIHGTNLVVAEHLKDWETLTSVYLQKFYNGENESRDYVQNTVNSVMAQIEILSVEYAASEVRSTTIKFKVPISWETTDDSISFITIVSQPFITKEYRQSYIEHMKLFLPGTFSVVTDVSSLSVQSQNDVTTSEYVLTNTFLCGDQWPVDCSATSCNHADDCPSSQGCFASSKCLAPEPDDEFDATINDEESSVADEPAVSTPCSLCRIDQVISSYNEVKFNRKAINCAGAFEFVSKFEEGSASCISAKDALAGDCCVDLSNDTSSGNTDVAPVVVVDTQPEPVVINTVDESESSNESSHLEEPESSTQTAQAINDQWQWNTSHSGKESTPQQENKGSDEDSEPEPAWFGEWESNWKMTTSSSCAKSVGAATLISMLVLELILR